MQFRSNHLWAFATAMSALLLFGCTSQTASETATTTPTTRVNAPITPTTAGSSGVSTISCGVYVPASQGAPISITSSSGPLQATLKGTEGGGYNAISGGVLTIADGSATLFKGALVQPNVGPPPVPTGSLNSYPVGLDPLTNFQNGGSGLPVYNNAQPPTQYPLCIVATHGPMTSYSIMLEVDTGGAHCCSVVDTWAVTGGKNIAYSSALVGNGYGYLTTVDGQTVLVGQDNRFAYVFDSYAGSAMPIRIYKLGTPQNHTLTSSPVTLGSTGSGWTDITKQFPAIVSKEAQLFLVQYQSSLSEHYSGLGVLAGWAADECVLGRSAEAGAYINSQLKAGHLISSAPGMGLPSGAAFVTALKKFLISTGYCSLS